MLLEHVHPSRVLTFLLNPRVYSALARIFTCVCGRSPSPGGVLYYFAQSL